MRRTTVRAELCAERVLCSALRARSGLSLTRGTAGALATDCACHHLSKAQTEPEAHPLSGRSAFLFGCVLNCLSGFEL